MNPVPSPRIFLLFLCLLAPLGVGAQPDDTPGGGSLLLATENGAAREAPLVSTQVRIDVTGLIVRARVEQTFVNPSPNWTEGKYVFPLPEGAAVDHLDMQVGDRRIEGRIEEREQAKRTYEQAREQGKVASLVEQERPNLFTQSVANIAPNAQVIVAIEYQDTVTYRDGRFRLRFPMVVGPRYIPGEPVAEVAAISADGWGTATDQVPDASRITPPVSRPDERRGPSVELRVQLAAGLPLGEVVSSSHLLRTHTDADQVVTVELRDDVVPANRDFLLEWSPSRADAPRAALFGEQVDGRTHALLMLAPPAGDADEQPIMAREVVFVVDTSGSMAGESLPQAKAALQLALRRLRPGDRFNIIRFSNTTQALYSRSQPARPGNLERADAYVSALRADGGTEMAPALQRALHDTEDGAGLRQVVFLTDGAIGNEDALFDLIRAQLGRSRLFTVGIGSAPNSWFMTRAAEFGRGSYTYISDLNQVQSRMEGLFRRLERPAMTDLTLTLPDGLEAEIHPRRIPDLYDGEPLMVVMRLPLATTELSGYAEISGRRGNRSWQVRLPLSEVGQGKGIGVLWARRRIADLSAVDGRGEVTDARRHILATALAYHLVSRYTSLVAVDVTPSRPMQETLASHAVATQLPKGWEFHKVFGGMPRTATPAPLFLAIGLGLMIVGAVIASGRRMLR